MSHPRTLKSSWCLNPGLWYISATLEQRSYTLSHYFSPPLSLNHGALIPPYLQLPFAMSGPPKDAKEQKNDTLYHPTVTLVMSSSKETLILTRRGEVLVYHHPQPNVDQKRLSNYYESTHHSPKSSDNADEIVSKLSISCRVDSDTFCNERERLCDCDKSTSNDECISRRSAKTRDFASALQYPVSTLGNMNSMEQYDEHKLTSDYRDHHLDGCDFSEEVDETMDMVDVDAMTLNQDYFSRGSISPTPVASFDYYGYEPPTPHGYEPPTPDSICLPDRPPPPNVSTNHSYQNLDHNVQTHLSIQNETGPLYGCDAPPLPAVSADSYVLPGFPTFLHHLSHVRITSLSAHPLGNHVLLISDEGLLFSYGSNEYGQLGLGNRPMKAPLSPSNGGQYCHPNPTIVTPLLENGGKTVR
jgi:hypothetical protein